MRLTSYKYHVGFCKVFAVTQLSSRVLFVLIPLVKQRITSAQRYHYLVEECRHLVIYGVELQAATLYQQGVRLAPPPYSRLITFPLAPVQGRSLRQGIDVVKRDRHFLTGMCKVCCWCHVPLIIARTTIVEQWPRYGLPELQARTLYFAPTLPKFVAYKTRCSILRIEIRFVYAPVDDCIIIKRSLCAADHVGCSARDYDK